MRKILSLLGAILFSTTTSASIIACGKGDEPKPEPSPTPKQKIGISTKISNSIDLGQLSKNTKLNFLNKLQDKLKTMSG
ncbi:lipoprotein, partial [Borreliella garinii]|uniref:lipoprotein n=1 Tax=Borreliella garinii TaxID=29519 RepID=UPI001AEFAA32